MRLSVIDAAAPAVSVSLACPVWWVMAEDAVITSVSAVLEAVMVVL